MKSNRKKRVLATILCMVMVLTSSISALAEGEMIIPEPNAPVAEEPAAENIEMQQETYTEPQVPEQPSEEIVPETTTPEVPVPEETVPETTIPETPAPEETAPETTPEAPAPEETVPETTTPEAPAPEETVPETTTPETTEPEKTEEEKEEEPAPVFSEAVEFHQDFVDGSGNLVQRITAKLPAGAFEAETSQITMEANYVDAGMQDYIKGMMEERLPEGNELGDYMLFDIQFKVNGEVRESLEPITLIFEKSDLEIPDTKKANVFYFDPKNPEDSADKDELIEIIQRSELIEAFQAEGRSTDTMEEDYDLSSIEMKEENRSGRIDLEGRLSTIYGCYVEKEPEKVQEETTEEKKDNETQEEAVTPQEQAPEKEGTLVEITAEETSLYRSTEEKEENIAATAKKGEQFPLLSTISIGETVWYKVQYTKPDTEETTELYVKADAAKLADPIMELNYEDETVIIKVTAEEAGVIPKDAELKVLPITSEDAETKTQYEEVEQKIQEKVAEEEKEVAGFLAYDITFVDKDGNKMEPNGKVKVSMEYKKAELPQEVKEKKATDAEVTVLHLEEDEKGAVKQVVDMAAEQKATVDTLATTEGTKVQKVEVETESFSVFTITWNQYVKLKIHIIDSSGSSIGQDKEIQAAEISGIAEESGAAVGKIAQKYTVPGYIFNYAVVKKGNIKSASDLEKATKITKLRKYRIQTSYYSDNEWNSLSDTTNIYFVYNRESMVYFVSGTNGQDIQPAQTLESFFSSVTTNTTENLAPKIEGYRFVKTVVADRYNEYENQENDGSCWALRLRKNSGVYQYNRARIDGADNNRWDEIKKPVYFIYKEDQGQIATRDSSSDGISLNIFNYDKSINEKASGAEFPFYNGATNNVDGRGGSNTGGKVKSTLENGYPVSQNETSLEFLFQTNESTQANYLFQYDEKTRCYEYNSLNNHAYYDKEQKRFWVYDYTLSPSHSGYGDFNVGNFLPFNDVINPTHQQLNYVHKDDRTHVDYWFGMTMGLKFYQPKDGKIENEPMKFEFSGDDDVFVYLDGVLILDLGGIHSAQKGSIDFSTGTVIQNGTTLKVYDLYEKSGLFTKDELDKKFETKSVNGKTCKIFKGDSVTQMDFFYLERGAGASNCHIKFNMPTIPKDTIIVGKEIENANAVEYSDVEFSFKLELQEEGQTYHTLTNTTVEVRDTTGKLIDSSREVDKDGIFKLRHGEQAYFKGYPITTKYRVTEVGVNSQEYDEITIEGVHIDQIQGDGQETTIQSWRTDELQVSETPRVIFRNRIDPNLNTELRIKKILNAEEDKEFQIKVYFGNSITNPNNEAYAGEYYIDQTKYVATDGIIKLKAGKTAAIMRLPSGTSFKVQEVDPNTGSTDKLYEDPTYQIKYLPGTGNETSGEITKDSASGTTILGNTEVTVTNTKINTPPPTDPETYDNVPHNKYIDYLGDGGNNNQTALRGPEYYRLYLDVKGIPNEKPEPADIVLVLDYSSSMRNPFSNSTRWHYVKESAKLAVNTLLPEGSENQVGIVWFDEQANKENVNFTKDKSALLKNIEDKEYDSGTNYQAAFWNAQEMLEQSTGRKKFVVFVTDGEPYQYYSGTKDEQDENHLKSDGVDAAKKAAMKAAKEFSDLNGFYAVSVGNNKGTAFLRDSILPNVTAAPTEYKKVIGANNEAELTKAFNTFMGSITKQIGNVSITDQLSNYVEFVNEAGDVLSDNDNVISGMKGDAIAQGLGLQVNWYNYNEGTYDNHSDIVHAEEYSGDYTYEINLNTKTIKVSFGEEYFLERDKVYTISFNVKLTEAATPDAMNHVDQIGDANTDYPENTTSSGKKGLFSNTEAILTYERVTNGEKKEEKLKDYERPVVQPYERATWEIVKVSKADSNKKLLGAEFTLSQDGRPIYKGITNSDGIVEWYKIGNTEQKLNSSQDLESGTYVLSETKAPEGYVMTAQTWTVEISVKGRKPVIKKPGGEDVTDAVLIQPNPQEQYYVMKIENEALYELPSTGGPGIFVYTIGGTLLLMAASLLLYKMKREGVLKG